MIIYSIRSHDVDITMTTSPSNEWQAHYSYIHSISIRISITTAAQLNMLSKLEDSQYKFIDTIPQ